MKKIALLLSIIIVLTIPLNTMAATPWAIKTTPQITFSGTSATCTVRTYADTSYDYIVLVIKLWHDSEVLYTWTATGTGSVSFSRTVAVESGETYRLAVETTVNGSAKPSASYTATCP